MPPGPPLTRFADEAELRALLTVAGLHDAAVRTLTWTHSVPGLDAWWEGAMGSMVRAAASVLGHPAEVQARIRAAFERGAQAYRGERGFIVPVAAKIAAGRRA